MVFKRSHKITNSLFAYVELINSSNIQKSPVGMFKLDLYTSFCVRSRAYRKASERLARLPFSSI